MEKFNRFNKLISRILSVMSVIILAASTIAVLLAIAGHNLTGEQVGAVMFGSFGAVLLLSIFATMELW